MRRGPMLRRSPNTGTLSSGPPKPSPPPASRLLPGARTGRASSPGGLQSVLGRHPGIPRRHARPWPLYPVTRPRRTRPQGGCSSPRAATPENKTTLLHQVRRGHDVGPVAARDHDCCRTQAATSGDDGDRPNTPTHQRRECSRTWLEAFRLCDRRLYVPRGCVDHTTPVVARPEGRLPLRQELRKLRAAATSLVVRTKTRRLAPAVVCAAEDTSVSSNANTRGGACSQSWQSIGVGPSAAGASFGAKAELFRRQPSGRLTSGSSWRQA